MVQHENQANPIVTRITLAISAPAGTLVVLSP
jgi:hypothetical protein